MKFIDFFAGIGGIRLGLERAGHECVGFCEFDKFARQSYKAIHETKNEWEAHDVRTVNSTDVPKADLWCFGFPCQDLSVAGKQKGLQAGERSGLFYEIMRLLAGLQKEDRPKYLLVENVKNLLSIGGGFDFLRLLVEMGGHGYDVEWQVLNSKDFGVPQNRERVFLIGRLGGASGREVFPLRRTDGENPCKLSEITSGVSDAFRVYEGNGLARTLKGEAGGGGAKTGLYTVESKIKVLGNYMPSGHNAGNIYDVNGIAPTVMDNYGIVSAVAIDMTENKLAITDSVRCLKARYTAGITNRSGDNSGILVKPALTSDGEEKRQNGRRMKEDGEPMFTLTAQDRHGVAIQQLGHGFNNGGVHEIAPTVTGSAYQDNNFLRTGVRIRKLTPRECWRLQGFPDECFDKAVAAGVSNSQLYKQAGNAVTVNVAEAIGRRLREIEMDGDKK